MPTIPDIEKQLDRILWGNARGDVVPDGIQLFLDEDAMEKAKAALTQLLVEAQRQTLLELRGEAVPVMYHSVIMGEVIDKVIHKAVPVAAIDKILEGLK